MACGVPLVTTTGGALPEVVGPDGESALVVPPADPSALTSAIVRALDDPQLRDRLGEGGRRRVLDRFTWQRTAQGTAEHYYLELEANARRAHDARHRSRS
jgi:glycosyltransferase involved in cell wall biosynthesis